MLNKMQKPLCGLLICLIILSGSLSVIAEAGTDPVLRIEDQSGQTQHVSYINGFKDGTFHPSRYMTRAEASAMLYRLLDNVPSDRAELSDVPGDAWFYDPVSLLAAANVLDVTGGSAMPNARISRGEFTAMLVRLIEAPQEIGDTMDFPDLKPDYRYYDELCDAVSYGWISGYEDGSVRPGGALTRAEAVTVINRAVGRAPDAASIDSFVLPLYEDVPTSHWAYYDVMEASIGHSKRLDQNGTEDWFEVDLSLLQRPAGFYHVSDGFDYYYIDQDTGLPVKNTFVGGLYFGADGKYTSGDAEVDGYVKAALGSVVKPGMTSEEKLRAAYNYTRDSFVYLRRNYYAVGDVSWAINEARTMFTTGRGNCYCFAAVFYHLAKQLGYDAVLISGRVNNSSPVPHAWVEIAFEGQYFMYDAELEMSYRVKGNYSYDFYHMARNETPWRYWWTE